MDGDVSSPKLEVARKAAAVVQALPPLPVNVDRLLEASVRAPDDREVLLDIVRGDSGLATELLHLANSSCLGVPGGIASLEDAVDRVGTLPLALLVGTRYAGETIEDRFAEMTHLDQYFAHAQEMAMTCRVLAEVCGLPAREARVYGTAGLVHDIGRLVILMATNRTGAPLMGTTLEEMCSIAGKESALYGLNHCDVGMEICRKWRFTDVMQEGILRHHTPLLDGDLCYPGAMIFAAHFVAGNDFTGEVLAGVLPKELLDALDLNAERFDAAKKLYVKRTS